MRKKKPYKKTSPVELSDGAKQLLQELAFLAYLAYKNNSNKEIEPPENRKEKE